MAGGSDQPASRRDINVVVVGDTAIGKTRLCNTYQQGSFPDDDPWKATYSFDNFYIDLTLDGRPVNLRVWDTAGLEDYDRIRALVYPKADVCMICYAINSIASFEKIMEKWVHEVRHYCPRARVVLVATKADCRGGDPETIVDRARGHRLAVQELKADGFVECSARTGESVVEAFQTAVRAVLDAPQLETEKQGCACALI